MSVKVMSAIFDRYPNGGGEMLLALALADHAHDDGTSVRPSVRTLAKKTRQSERTVQYQLRKMQACGWLILVRISSGKPGDTNEYKINFAWLTGAKSDGCNFCTGAIDDIDGCNQQHGRVQNDAETGATAIAPKPLLEPSIKPSINLPPTPQGAEGEENQHLFTDSDTRRFFLMPMDWKPDPVELQKYINGKIHAGKPLTLEQVMAHLEDYREATHAKGEKRTESEWCRTLVKWAMRCLGNPRASEKTPEPPPAYREYQPPVLPERTPEMAANARKHMGKLRELLA